MKPELFTIGHSNHSAEAFLELLQRHRIQVVIDVRSSPYSARLPQFNRETLKVVLRAGGIRYLFLGEELGARRSEQSCYVDGVARYEKIAETVAFQSGLQRVRQGIPQFRSALMCAEKDPLECHRTVLICRQLRLDARIQHILADGSLETHEVAEARLLAEEKIPGEDFFATREELLDRAYHQRGGNIAYHEAAEPAETA